MSSIGSALKGMYRDVLIGPGGSIVYDSGWLHNTIVEPCHVLLAELLNLRTQPAGDEQTEPPGVRFLEVGRGYGRDWKPNEVPAPANARELADKEQPRSITELYFAYVDANGMVMSEPTQWLQVTVMMGPGVPDSAPYPLREFGLFGGVGSKKYMINYVRHPLIVKEQDMTLQRIIRLEC